MTGGWRRRTHRAPSSRAARTTTATARITRPASSEPRQAVVGRGLAVPDGGERHRARRAVAHRQRARQPVVARGELGRVGAPGQVGALGAAALERQPVRRQLDPAPAHPRRAGAVGADGLAAGGRGVQVDEDAGLGGDEAVAQAVAGPALDGQGRRQLGRGVEVAARVQDQGEGHEAQPDDRQVEGDVAAGAAHAVHDVAPSSSRYQGSQGA